VQLVARSLRVSAPQFTAPKLTQYKLTAIKLTAVSLVTAVPQATKPSFAIGESYAITCPSILLLTTIGPVAVGAHP
jgi:hypothetical protein